MRRFATLQVTRLNPKNWKFSPIPASENKEELEQALLENQVA